MKTLSKLFKHNLVKGLPSIKYEKDRICEARVKGKQTKSSFNSKNAVSSQKNPRTTTHKSFLPNQNT